MFLKCNLSHFLDIQNPTEMQSVKGGGGSGSKWSLWLQPTPDLTNCTMLVKLLKLLWILASLSPSEDSDGL